MTSVKELFFHRLRKEWRYQYEVWKTAVDWVVWLYILIPALGVLGYQYYLVWDGIAEWVTLFPEVFFWLPLFFLSRFATVRLFLREGDLLFIRQQNTWYSTLLRLGFIYTLLRNALILAVVAMLLLPFWLFYIGASTMEIILALSFATIFQWVGQLGRQMLALRYRRWKQAFMNLIFLIVTFQLFQLFFFGHVFIQIILIIVFAMACYWLIRKRLLLTSTFFEDCLRENQERLKLSSIFIAISGYKQEQKQRKRPWVFFSKSTKLFKDRSPNHLLAETLIKRTIRSKSKLRIIFQFTALGVFVIVITPVQVKWVLLVICNVALIHFIKWSWRDMRTHPFLKLFHFHDDESLLNGVRKAISLLAMPSAALLGLVAGWTSSGSLLIGVITAILSPILSYSLMIKSLYLL